MTHPNLHQQLGLALLQVHGLWRELGLELDLFHQPEAVLPVLRGQRASQLQALLAALEALAADPAACRDLEVSLRHGLLRSANPATTGPLLHQVMPVLRLTALNSSQPTPPPAPSRPATPAAPGSIESLLAEGISSRAYRVLLGRGWRRLADLAGKEEQHLLAIRGFGQQALEDLRLALGRLGLALPFSPADLQAMLRSAADQAPQAPADGEEPCDHEAEQRWCRQVCRRIGDTAAACSPQRLVEELQALSVERFGGLSERRGELEQLQRVLGAVADGGTQVDTADGTALAMALQRHLLQAYGERISAELPVQAWLQTLQQLVLCHQMVPPFLLHASGVRLAAQQSLARLEKAAGCKARALGEELRHQQQAEQGRSLAAALAQAIAQRGRLPFHTDDQPELEGVSRLSLAQRLALHAEHGLEVPAAEWDLHFRVITNGEEPAGTGYWDAPETLRHYLHRHASFTGTPGQMPYQVALPRSVAAGVQRHGGQSGVARQVGLRYRGQAVGEYGGRVYWTLERLASLLRDTVAFHQLADDAMPSTAQISAFMASGQAHAYAGQRSASAIAALRGHGRRSWEEAAACFGRRTAGLKLAD